MDQKRQRRLIGPLKVIQDEQVRTRLGRAPQRLGNALKKIAALLRRWQYHGWRNIRKYSSQAGCDLGEFARIFPHLATEIIETRGLRQAALKDLGEREIRN